MKSWILFFIMASAVTAGRVLVKGDSGFVRVNDDGDDYFYLLYSPKNLTADSPVLIWMAGGPGSTSTWDSVGKHGPNRINFKTNKTELNPYSWNENAYLLYVDQPVGVPYGHGRASNMPKTAVEYSITFIAFLKGLYKLHPGLEGRSLYISGNSYAGKYVPAIANAVFLFEKNRFKLRGVGMGNGWTSPQNQITTYAEYMLNRSDITNFTQARFDKYQPLFRACHDLYLTEPLPLSRLRPLYCDDLVYALTKNDEGECAFDYYDITKPCPDPEADDPVADYLNDPSVITELGFDTQWQDGSDKVYELLTSFDEAPDFGPYLKPLLESGDVKVVAFYGDYDYMCNYLGGLAWMDGLEWSGQDAFKKAPVTQYLLKDGTPIGTKKEAGNLRFVRIYNASHEAVIDKPRENLHVINALMGFAD